MLKPPEAPALPLGLSSCLRGLLLSPQLWQWPLLRLAYISETSAMLRSSDVIADVVSSSFGKVAQEFRIFKFFWPNTSGKPSCTSFNSVRFSILELRQQRQGWRKINHPPNRSNVTSSPCKACPSKVVVRAHQQRWAALRHQVSDARLTPSALLKVSRFEAWHRDALWQKLTTGLKDNKDETNVFVAGRVNRGATEPIVITLGIRNLYQRNCFAQ